MNQKILFDDYGFKLSDTFDPQQVEKFKRSYEDILRKRKHRWEEIMVNGKIPKFDGKMKRFVRKGIPAQYRPQMWFVYSGAEKLYENNEGGYTVWNRKTVSSENSHVIEADLPRTFPENERFRNPEHPESLLGPLRRLLIAFVSKNPEIGYCQGMNFIAGLILLVMMPDEEKAFWVFDTLASRILQSYYLPGMIRVQVDCMVFEELIRSKLPTVHFVITEQCGASCIMMCAKWFLCSFVDVLPIQTVLRVLDCVLCEGEKILFRAALSLVRLNEAGIARCNGIAQLMDEFRLALRSESVLYSQQFTNCMFSMIGSLSKKTVDQLRREAEVKVKSQCK